MNRCTDCGLAKNLSAFGRQKDYRTGKQRARAACLQCRGAIEKKRYQLRTETQKLASKNRILTRLYGITLEQYNQMFEAQKGACTGCQKHQSQLTKSLAVDHDHITGKVRGLLCVPCNVVIGNARDNPQTLHRLIAYLEGAS